MRRALRKRRIFDFVPSYLKGPSVITDICKKTITRQFSWAPSVPPPKTNMYVLYTGPIFSGDELHTCTHNFYDAFFFVGGGGGGGGGGEAKVSEAKIRAQDMTIITCLACCICKTEVACRTRAADTTVIGRVGASKLDESSAHRNLAKVLHIEAWRKCCAFCSSRTPIIFKKQTLPNPTPPKRRVFVFSRGRPLNDGRRRRKLKYFPWQPSFHKTVMIQVETGFLFSLEFPNTSISEKSLKVVSIFSWIWSRKLVDMTSFSGNACGEWLETLRSWSAI